MDCPTCDGVGGVELTDSMTLYGVPGGSDYARRCPDCKGTGVAQLTRRRMVAKRCPEYG